MARTPLLVFFGRPVTMFLCFSFSTRESRRRIAGTCFLSQPFSVMKTIRQSFSLLRHRPVLLGLLAASFLTLDTAACAQHFGSAFRVGGNGNDEGTDIVRDKDGNVFVTGFFMDTVDADPGPATVNLTSAGAYDAFVAKYDHDHQLLWARRFGGTGTEFGQAIALDAGGNVVITGTFEGTVDFDPGPATLNLISAGQSDSFVCKLEGSSGNLVWAKRLGGTASQSAQGITVDASGNVITIGEFTGTADFDPGLLTTNLTATGENDIYISKLSTSGLFVWAKRLGGNGDDHGHAVGVDGAGNIYSTGLFSGTGDFDPGPGLFNMTANGSGSASDIFVCKLNAAGIFQWAKRFGSTGHDSGNDLAVDSVGTVSLTGTFSGVVDFDPNSGILNLDGTTGKSFVTVLNTNGNMLWARNLGGEAKSLVVDSLGNTLIAGSFDGTRDFDPGTGFFTLTSSGGDDVFITKLDAGGSFIWAGRMGGPEDDIAYGITTDAVSANVWTTGLYGAAGDFDPGPGVFELPLAGQFTGIWDLFVSRLTTHSKVLWSDEAGSATLLTVDGCGDKTGSKSYKATGFVATSYDRMGEGGTGRILWADQTNGKALLWTLDNNEDVKNETVLTLKPGWKAVSYRTSEDGTGKLLWEHTDGSKQFWTVDALGNFVCGTEFGDSANWKVRTFCR